MNRRLILFPLFFLLTAALFSQNLRTCDKIKSFLDDNEIDYSIQTLSFAQNTDFPYSIIIKKKADNVQKHTLAIIIPQNNALLMMPEIIRFSEKLDKIKTQTNIEIVLTANDYSLIPVPETKDNTPGTNTYLSNFDSTEKLYAVVISSTNNELSQIPIFSYTAKHKASHPAFVKNIMQAMKDSDLEFQYYPSSIGFIRLGATESDPIFENLMKNEIPSVHFSANPKVLESILIFISDYSLPEENNWDNQYFLFTKKPLIISQTVFVIIMIMDIAIGLFLLCFSFLLGNFVNSRKKDLLDTSYLLFLITVIYLTSLYLAQICTKAFIPNWNQNAIFAFCTKIVLTFAFYNLFSKIRFFLYLPQTDYIYGFLLSVSAFSNILIFAVSDLSFLMYFTIFYIFAIASRLSKKSTYQVIFLWLMMIVFLPLFIISEKNLSDIAFYFTNGTFFNNLFLSLFFTPFTVLSIRLNVNSSRYKNHDIKNRSEYKILLKKLCFSLGILVFVVIGIWTAKLINTKLFTEQKVMQVIHVEQNPENSVSVKLKQNFTLGKENLEISIGCPKNTIRYIIKISSSTLMPIYSANYPFDAFCEKNSIVFDFEEFPPEKNELNISANPNQDYLVTVITYTQKDQYTIEKTEQELFIKGKAGDGRTI
ncbi:MAG: hypothetical protein ACTTHG_04915 [Treponemataceae bacterium]